MSKGTEDSPHVLFRLCCHLLVNDVSLLLVHNREKESLDPLQGTECLAVRHVLFIRVEEKIAQMQMALLPGRGGDQDFRKCDMV